MKISVIVPTLDRNDFLLQCLTSLTHQTRKPDEVLVVNNGKNEKSYEITRSFDQKLNTRYLKEYKKGVASARNKGLKEAQHEIIAFIDDDCVAEKHWVERMVNLHEKDVIALQGREINAMPQNPYASAAYHVDESWVSFRRSRSHTLHLRKTKDDKLQQVYYIDTKNFSIKKKALVRDRHFFREDYQYCCEDMDMAAQLQARGMNIMYSPTVVVRHQRPSNLRELLRNKFRRGEDFYRYRRRWGKSSQKIEQLTKHAAAKTYFKEFWATHIKERKKLLKSLTKQKSWHFMLNFQTGILTGKLAFKSGYYFASLTQ